MNEETESDSVTQQLQNKVDKIQLINAISKIPALTPPLRQEETGARDIALVQALSVNPRIADLFLEIRGLEYDNKSKQYVQVTRPIMNIEGAYRFCKLLKRLSQEIEWATYSEEELPLRIIHYFEENIPYFLFYGQKKDITILQKFSNELIIDPNGNIVNRQIFVKTTVIKYHEENDYDLHPSDFNYIISLLQNFIDTAFHKSKQGKYINTLGRTYGEDILKKALDTEKAMETKRGGFLEKFNPFPRDRR